MRTLMAPLLKVQSRLKANGVRLIFCRLNAEFCMNYSILYRVPGWVIEQQGALKTKPKKILINWILLVEMQKVLYCAESAEGVFLIYLCIFLCVVGRYTGNFAFFSRWMNKFKFKLIGCKKKNRTISTCTHIQFFLLTRFRCKYEYSSRVWG